MTGLLIFAAFIVGLVLLFRYLRKREVEAFMDADMTDFHLHNAAAKKENKDPLMARAEAYAALNPNVVSLETTRPSDTEEVDVNALPDPTLYRLKAGPFDEIKKHFLITLHEVLESEFALLSDVPLAEFVTSEKKENDYKLQNTRVGYLICDKKDMGIICGVQFKGEQGGDFIKGVFGDIGLPLVEFPPSADVSRDEISDQLDVILKSSGEHPCPKCGDPMTMRKAVKGRNTGTIFWVCTRFPSCRGVVRVS